MAKSSSIFLVPLLNDLTFISFLLGSLRSEPAQIKVIPSPYFVFLSSRKELERVGLSDKNLSIIIAVKILNHFT